MATYIPQLSGCIRVKRRRAHDVARTQRRARRLGPGAGQGAFGTRRGHMLPDVRGNICVDHQPTVPRTSAAAANHRTPMKPQIPSDSGSVGDGLNVQPGGFRC